MVCVQAEHAPIHETGMSRKHAHTHCRHVHTEAQVGPATVTKERFRAQRTAVRASAPHRTTAPLRTCSHSIAQDDPSAVCMASSSCRCSRPGCQRNRTMQRPVEQRGRAVLPLAHTGSDAGCTGVLGGSHRPTGPWLGQAHTDMHAHMHGCAEASNGVR